jgi:hypothetical protein
VAYDAAAQSDSQLRGASSNQGRSSSKFIGVLGSQGTVAVRNWVFLYPDFFQQYAHAREAGAGAIADLAVEAATAAMKGEDVPYRAVWLVRFGALTKH